MSKDYLFRGIKLHHGDKTEIAIKGINDGERFSRLQVIIAGLHTICDSLGIGVPLWNDENIVEFKKYGRTRFLSEDFFPVSFEHDIRMDRDFEFLEFELIGKKV